MKDALYTIALLNADHYEALARRAQRSDDELAEFFRAMRATIGTTPRKP